MTKIDAYVRHEVCEDVENNGGHQILVAIAYKVRSFGGLVVQTVNEGVRHGNGDCDDHEGLNGWELDGATVTLDDAVVICCLAE